MLAVRRLNFIGSKQKLLPFIAEKIFEVISFSSNRPYSIVDLYAGTGTISKYFKHLNFSVWANDFLYSNFIKLAYYMSVNKREDLFKSENPLFLSINEVVDYLNNMPYSKGFIYENYTYGGTQNKEFVRQYFIEENALKCDTIKKQIYTWYNENKILEEEFFFLMTCLLEAVDKVANTASVYASFLKSYKLSAKKVFELKPVEIISGELNCRAYNYYDTEFFLNVLPKASFDILYMDPPYNSRQYFDYYHILETIANEKDPEIKGKTGIPINKKLSPWSSKKECANHFTEVVMPAVALNNRFNYIFMSYNNEGILPLELIEKTFKKYGKYTLFSQEYNRYKADNNRNYKSNKTTEYLHCLELERKRHW